MPEEKPKKTKNMDTIVWLLPSGKIENGTALILIMLCGRL